LSPFRTKLSAALSAACVPVLPRDARRFWALARRVAFTAGSTLHAEPARRRRGGGVRGVDLTGSLQAAIAAVTDERIRTHEIGQLRGRLVKSLHMAGHYATIRQRYC
jgi:hypothetical protein